MVDVVANHFGYNGNVDTIDYSTMTPFNKQSDFHPVCWITDYTNQTQAEQVRFYYFFVVDIRRSSLNSVGSAMRTTLCQMWIQHFPLCAVHTTLGYRASLPTIRVRSRTENFALCRLKHDDSGWSAHRHSQRRGTRLLAWFPVRCR